MKTPEVIDSPEQALQRLRQLSQRENERVIIGIIGKPGAGKSTLTSFLIENLTAKKAALVPMDGYHLSNKLLSEQGKLNRKGAHDTFDDRGYVEILKRIKFDLNSDIYFPIFHREIEESIVAEGVVSKECNLVITEGNYLLCEINGWRDVKPLLTESWYIQIEDNLRLERLVARSIKYGRSPQAAFDWAHGSDEDNAKIIEPTKNFADVLLKF